ncbi:hypothetical protein GCM10009576_099460 [Streptomyces rhizosphaericus]|uniref:Uncharacterized protein n=1 Tax=Streptomyces rhizosphaericus TaxID=114699 RepID=A0ABN1TD76_9ACTN
MLSAVRLTVLAMITENLAEAPCKLCGSPVYLADGMTPRRMAAPPQPTKIRRCSNAECRSNRSGPKRITETP